MAWRGGRDAVCYHRWRTNPGVRVPSAGAAALSAMRGDLLIVPARASFLADDQLGFVQTADFQYLTGIGEVVGAVLVPRRLDVNLDVVRPTTQCTAHPRADRA